MSGSRIKKLHKQFEALHGRAPEKAAVEGVMTTFHGMYGKRPRKAGEVAVFTENFSVLIKDEFRRFKKAYLRSRKFRRT